MAKKKKGKKIPSKTDINSVEKETIRRVNKTIKTIEEFLAKWNGAKTKPEGMLAHIKKIKAFHRELEKWQKTTIKAQRKDTEEAKVRRLRNFILLCNTYSQV